MACNCKKSGGGMDDASVNYLLSLVKQEPDANGELSLLDTGDQFIQALVNIILEKAQYLDPIGLEYLISRLQMMYVVKEDGMGLTHNDFTDALKKKLEALPTNEALKDILEELAGGGLAMEIVETLPDVGDPKKLYFVPRDKSETNNVYDEYVYINNKWERLGSTDISGIVTTIKLNGTDLKPDANGVINLGTVQTGGVDLSGYMPKSGGTFTGDIRLQTNSADYGSVLRFGDGDYAYISENEDDHFEVYSRMGINFRFPTSSGSFTINGQTLEAYLADKISAGIKSITMNGSSKTPDTNGNIALGNVAIKATMNGSTYNASSAGTLALGGVCIKITMNGSTFSVNSSGTIALGTVGANTIYTGTTAPASTLGADGDFYYKTK